MELKLTDLEEKTGEVESADGVKIFYRKYNAQEERARLVIVHGLGEHSGRYGNVVSELLPLGISIWALDLRGHGMSEGKRGHVQSFNDYIGDVLSTIKLAREGMGVGIKCFVLGHSMGGLIVLDFALEFPELIDRVTVSSPSLGIGFKVPFIKRALGKIMSSLFPALTLPHGMDISKLSHDREVVRSYADDPLVHDRVSVRWFTEVQKTMDKVNNSADRVKIPLLMQLAGDDHLTDVNASKRFFDGLTVDDKTLHIYERLYHEIYNEKEELRSRPLQDLSKWVDAHL